MRVPLARPDIKQEEKDAVLEVLGTPDLSLGPKLPEFEEIIAKYTGVKYSIAVNSGTSALHLIVRAMGIGEGDEVITTPFSFIASSNCILFEKARPVFVDIDPVTLNIDADLIERKITKRTKAILAVDVFGHPAEWDILKKIAVKHSLKLIDDSCEALGSEYKGKKAGSFGDAGTFAFYPNKQVTTGEGGIIVTDSGKLAGACRSMRNQGRMPGGKWLAHTRLGYNYRLSDINCALGIAQMKRIGGILAKRAAAAEEYRRRLREVENIDLPYISPGVNMSWFVYVVKLKKGLGRTVRDRVLAALREKGIGCSDYFTPIHLQPFYKKTFGYKKGDFPVTEKTSERTIALPFYNDLKKKQIEHVCGNLKDIVKGL